MYRKTSCIINNLGRYISLENSDKARLLNLESTPFSIEGKEAIWHVNSPVEKLYSIQSGWAYTMRDNLDGARQVVDILIPGDIIGLRDFTYKNHFTEARMITRGTLCPFTQASIVDIIKHSPSLTVALFAATARQESMITERMLISMHRSARSQIAHFIIEIYLRLNQVRTTSIDEFYLPVTQQMLGEILGISTVHINRSLIAMENDNILKKSRNSIHVTDEKKLTDEAEFNNDYLSEEMDGLSELL